MSSLDIEVRAAAADWIMGGLCLILEARLRLSALREMAATDNRSWCSSLARDLKGPMPMERHKRVYNAKVPPESQGVMEM